MTNVNSKEDFVKFMSSLINDLKDNPQKWENRSLLEYLEAIQSWTEDMDGYYVNNNLPVPENVSWNVFANILTAARIYE
jgi:hypothetical protein